MALPLLKHTPLGGSRRRRGLPWGALLTLLVLGGASWGAYTYFFGTSSAVNAAIKMARKGQIDAAEAKLLALDAKRPGDAIITDALGLIANRRKQTEKALGLYDKARQAGLGRGVALRHVEEGDAALARGWYSVAEGEYKHAMSLDKGNAKALKGAAVCAHAGGHLSSAIELYQAALASSPGLEEAKEGLRKARESRDRGAMYYVFDRNDSPLARVSIQQNNLGARSYPMSQHTAHIIGALSDKFGDMGLEKELKGLIPGLEIVLTLDSRVQDAAQKALGWRKGAIIVLDPSTGDILGAVSQPSFKPETIDKQWHEIRDNINKPLLNRPFMGLYEPGSICKIITAAAALEANVDMSKIFPMRPDTAILIEGKVFRDWENHGKIRSLKEAMDVSSNIALYRVADAMGPDVLFEYINRFGFNQEIDLGFDLPGVGKVQVPVAQSTAPLGAASKFELAERACGLGKEYRVTPLQASLLAQVIANRGILMRPRLVKEVRNLAGQTLWQSKKEVWREVMKPETAEKIKQIMIDAVEGSRGIGKKAQVPGVLVAGKTGTARTRKNLDGWFVCFAPADNPQYAVAVLADGEGTGMSIAAPIAGALLRNLMR